MSELKQENNKENNKLVACHFSYPQQLPYLQKLYDMVGGDSLTPRFPGVIERSENFESFLIIDQTRFINEVLPVYFKKPNYTSWRRMINLYGFETLREGSAHGPKGTFYNVNFKRGRPDLLLRMARQGVKPTKSDNKSETMSAASSTSERIDIKIELPLDKSLRSKSIFEKDDSTCSDAVRAPSSVSGSDSISEFDDLSLPGRFDDLDIAHGIAAIDEERLSQLRSTPAAVPTDAYPPTDGLPLSAEFWDNMDRQTAIMSQDHVNNALPQSSLAITHTSSPSQVYEIDGNHYVIVRKVVTTVETSYTVVPARQLAVTRPVSYPVSTTLGQPSLLPLATSPHDPILEHILASRHAAGHSPLESFAATSVQRVTTTEPVTIKRPLGKRSSSELTSSPMEGHGTHPHEHTTGASDMPYYALHHTNESGPEYYTDTYDPAQEGLELLGLTSPLSPLTPTTLLPSAPYIHSLCSTHGPEEVVIMEGQNYDDLQEQQVMSDYSSADRSSRSKRSRTDGQGDSVKGREVRIYM